MQRLQGDKQYDTRTDNEKETTSAFTGGSENHGRPEYESCNVATDRGRV